MGDVDQMALTNAPRAENKVVRNYLAARTGEQLHHEMAVWCRTRGPDTGLTDPGVVTGRNLTGNEVADRAFRRVAGKGLPFAGGSVAGRDSASAA